MRSRSSAYDLRDFERSRQALHQADPTDFIPDRAPAYFVITQSAVELDHVQVSLFRMGIDHSDAAPSRFRFHLLFQARRQSTPPIGGVHPELKDLAEPAVGR